MANISKKALQEYQIYIKEKTEGRILTPDGLKTICEACDYEPTAIGEYFLQTLVRFYPHGDKK